MRSFAFEHWDGGRVTVNRDFAGLLRANGLTTFDALMGLDGTVAKDLRSDRVTSRLELKDEEGHGCAFYIKRHGPSAWKESLKPLLRLTRPILGARNEWNALMRFHAAGLPTMVPVALGESRRHSFLITEAIDGCDKLSDWSKRRVTGESPRKTAQIQEIAKRLAGTARAMHRAGLHHQDFYLCHLLLEQKPVDPELYVIDLGRVRPHGRFARRWIIKDLAQLNYSGRHLPASERLRFLRTYLGRPLTRSDRGLIARIERKTAAIARHSRRNGL